MTKQFVMITTFNMVNKNIINKENSMHVDFQYNSYT